MVDLIESVDRLELLQCIEKQAAKVGVTQDILLEVNIGNEESKSGFTPDGRARLRQKWQLSPRAAALMAIPPVSENRAIIADILQKCGIFC